MNLHIGFCRHVGPKQAAASVLWAEPGSPVMQAVEFPLSLFFGRARQQPGTAALCISGPVAGHVLLLPPVLSGGHCACQCCWYSLRGLRTVASYNLCRRYEGEFYLGYVHGLGKYTSSINNTIYEGQWVFGREHG